MLIQHAACGTGGSDSLFGLSNHSPKIGAQQLSNDEVGLHNSYYG